MFKQIETVTHPKTDELSVDIFSDGVHFYFEENGDWYDETWCAEPQLECIAAAMDTLNQKYNGTYYETTYGEYSEQQVFAAI